MDDEEKWMIAKEIPLLLPPALAQFYDIMSLELLDEKVKVKEALDEGTPLDQIPDLYKVLELYPEDGEMWDRVPLKTPKTPYFFPYSPFFGIRL